MSIRALVVALILLVLLGDASADTVVIGTPGQIGAARFGGNVGGALAAGVDFARSKGQLNAQIGAARRRFFEEYPKGRDFAQAEKEFAELLWSKDVYFMLMRLSTAGTPGMLGKLDAVTGGTVDNGIPAGAGPAFNQWVSGIRDSLGGARVPSESQFLAALEANKDVYAQYKEARDLAEFEVQCRARPGLYCALPGGYSHGGATERAARIADYYLAHYVRTLSGGDAVKTKLRDAIIKYESLAYTTPDCIRHVSRTFGNGPRHDTNLAALRHAIAKYESVKVSPEDSCIWAAQDMERAEHARNRTPQVPPRPKDFWDTLFRNSKFNELYPLTSDQEREMRERRQAAVAGRSAPPSAQEPPAHMSERQRLLYARRMAATRAAEPKDNQAWPVTIIDYYTGSPEARAANVSRYEVVRLEATRKTAGVQSAARAPADTAVPEKRDLGTAPPAPTAAPGADALYSEGTKAYRSQDYSRARALWEQACAGGNAKSCLDLGVMVNVGKGGPPDKVRSLALFEKACNGGIQAGCAYLANLSPRKGSPQLRRP